MLNRKAIAILGAIFLLIIGTLGFLIYQRQSAKKVADSAVTPVEEQNTELTEEIPVEPEPIEVPETSSDTDGAVKVSDDQVVSPVLFFQGNGITYFTSTGQLYQVDLLNSSDKYITSNKRELTISPKSGISKILWPSAGNNFIAEIQSGSSRRWSFYNSDTGAYVDLPSQITSLSWMPGGDKIAYIWLDSKGDSTLNIASPDNSNYQTVADIWEDDDEINVSPDGQSILFYQRSNPSPTNSINLTTPDGKVFRSVVKDGYNYGVLWSPDSRKFLFGKRESSGSSRYQLWVADLSSGEVKNLGVSGSIEKAIWSKDSQYVYAAVGAQSGLGSGQDKLMKLGVSSGEAKEYDLKISVDARDLFFSSNGDAMFFKNAQDGALYYIKLGQ